LGDFINKFRRSKKNEVGLQDEKKIRDESEEKTRRTGVDSLITYKKGLLVGSNIITSRSLSDNERSPSSARQFSYYGSKDEIKLQIESPMRKAPQKLLSSRLQKLIPAGQIIFEERME